MHIPSLIRNIWYGEHSQGDEQEDGDDTAEIMRKYGIKEGMRVKFVEAKAGPLMIPMLGLDELHGIEKGRKKALIEAVKELEEEHR